MKGSRNLPGGVEVLSPKPEIGPWGRSTGSVVRVNEQGKPGEDNLYFDVKTRRQIRRRMQDNGLEKIGLRDPDFWPGVARTFGLDKVFRRRGASEKIIDG